MLLWTDEGNYISNGGNMKYDKVVGVLPLDDLYPMPQDMEAE